jgi:hypothetical protein
MIASAFAMVPARVRDQVRAAARAIRGAPTSEHVWAVLTRILPRLDCEEIRLAIDANGAAAGSHDDRPAIYHWRRSSEPRASSWRLDGVTPDVATIRMLLGEADHRFGELAVLLTERTAHSPGRAARELLFELLREALIDFRIVGRSQDESTAPWLAPAGAFDESLEDRTPVASQPTRPVSNRPEPAEAYQA